jgi:superfamily II DNA or RNA helicase
MSLPLYEYQQEAKVGILKNFDEGAKKILLQMPTGAGKTRLFSNIVSEKYMESDSFHALFVAHTEELIDQIGKTLSEYGIKYAFVKSGRNQDINNRIQIASIQSLRNRAEYDEINFDLIVIDEAHRTPADSYIELFERFPKANFLGVTATPFRMDGEILKDYYDKIVIGPSIGSLVNKEKKLSPFKYYTPKEEWGFLNDIKISQGDYNESELESHFNIPEIRAKIIEAYFKYCHGKKGIVYAINKNHALKLYADFLSNNIRAAYILSGETSAEKRVRILKKFKNGDYKVLINVNIFTEGFDSPDVDFVQLARPTKSLILYIQQVGRALRKTANKKFAIVLDNAGLALEHGIFYQEFDWQYIFENGLDTDYYDNKNQQSISKNLKERIEPIDIIEGDSELELIQFGEIEEETEVILDFFPEKLLRLFEYIKNAKIIRNEYTDVQTIKAVEHLEPKLYNIANANFDFFNQIQSDIDGLEKKINAIDFENKINPKEIEKIQNINDQLKKFTNDLKIKITDKNLKDIAKNNGIDYEFLFELYRNNIDLDKYIAELQNQDDEILKCRTSINKKKAVQDEIIEKSKLGIKFIFENEKSVVKLSSNTNIENTEINFEKIQKSLVDKILNDDSLRNKEILKSVLRSLQKIPTDSEFRSEIEKVYNQHSKKLDVPGIGVSKKDELSSLIKKYAVTSKENLALSNFNKKHKTEFTFYNTLKLFEDVLRSNNVFKTIELELIQNSSRFGYFKGTLNKKHQDIAYEYNLELNTIKAIASRLKGKISKIYVDVFKCLNRDEKEFLDSIAPKFKSFAILSMKDLKVINDEFDTSFSTSGLELILTLLYETEDYRVLNHDKFKNIYIFKKITKVELINIFKNEIGYPSNKPSSKILNLNRYPSIYNNIEDFKTILKHEYEPLDIKVDENNLEIIFRESETVIGKICTLFKDNDNEWMTASQVYERLDAKLKLKYLASDISADFLSRKSKFERRYEDKTRNQEYRLKD